MRVVAQRNAMENTVADRPVSETARGRLIDHQSNSGRRRQRTLDQVETALAARAFDVRVAATSGPGDATRLARGAMSEGAGVVAAARGDGTIR